MIHPPQNLVEDLAIGSAEKYNSFRVTGLRQKFQQASSGGIDCSACGVDVRLRWNRGGSGIPDVAEASPLICRKKEGSFFDDRATDGASILIAFQRVPCRTEEISRVKYSVPVELK